MMRAAVLTGASSADIRTCPEPHAGPGQVRVRLDGSGVCASNVPVWQGRPWFSYPMAPGAPGHEGWGVVDEVAADATGVREGDRVVLLSSRAYAEWDVADARQVVRIPAGLAGVPCPGEPLACAVNVVRRARIEPGEVVAVVGVGFLGALVVQLAVDRGATVVAVSRRPFARALARDLGAADAVPFEDAPALEAVRMQAGDKLSSCVIEACGEQSALDLASKLAGVRARLVIAGYHQEGLRQVNLQHWNWQGLDVINANEREPEVYIEGMREAIRLVESDVLDPARLVTHTVPLGDLDQAFTLMLERPDGFLKAAVLCGGSA